MFVPFHDDGIISQFEGYEKLREFDWDGYRTRYGNIQRLDLILEAEGDNANRYKLSKQADVLMLFYVFSAEELGGLLERLGYALERRRSSAQRRLLRRAVFAWIDAVPRRNCLGAGAIGPAAGNEVLRARRCKATSATSSRERPRRVFT